MMGNKIDNLIGKGRKITILWAFNRRNTPFSPVSLQPLPYLRKVSSGIRDESLKEE